MRQVVNYIVFLLCSFVFLGCVSQKTVHRFDKDYADRKNALQLSHVSDSLFILNKQDYFIQNKYGNWELYVSGDSFALGDKAGLLTRDLFLFQRRAFMEKLEEMVSSRMKQKLVLRFVNWYNRRLDNYIADDYLTELYALSGHLDEEYAYAGNVFHQTLYMHAAHDIGHALHDLAIVGCSSVASWGDKTEDGKLLIGRNFDFYVNDDFAKHKVINFVKGEKGIPFVSISWAGMAGVVSGMNLEGLTVTMNAGKSTIPLSAKTPISLIAREILQYATDIEEAIAIAKNRTSFVSESLMIGSAKDNKAVLLEISPKKMGIYEANGQNQLICTNHFQSEVYHMDKRNVKHMENSHSLYRYERLEELMLHHDKLNPVGMVDILRNHEGLQDKDIGLGNDKSLNHLLAHHAVVFQPDKRLIWVSNSPYQLGSFNAYDLRAIFTDTLVSPRSRMVDSLTIGASDFMLDRQYLDYEMYRKESDRIERAIKAGVVLSDQEIENYRSLNPNIWYVYYLSGKYYLGQGDYALAAQCFEMALTKEIPTVPTKVRIQKLQQKAQRKWKK